MKIDIRLNRNNKAILSEMGKALFPYFNYVKVRKSGVIFKRRWYSLKSMSSRVADFVLLELPDAINQYYQDNGFSPIFQSSGDLYKAIDNLVPLTENGDIVLYLYRKYNDLSFSVSLMEDYEAEPISFTEEDFQVETSRLVEKLVSETLAYYIAKTEDLVIGVEPTLQASVNLESRAPPIRAPDEMRLIA